MIEFADLSDLVQSVEKIRKLSPNTGNESAFREGHSITNGKSS